MVLLCKCMHLQKLAFLLQDIKAASAGDLCLLASWVRAKFNFFCEETRVPHCRWSCSAEFDFSRRNFCSAHVLSSFASRRSYWMQKAKWSSWLKADFSKASLFEANLDLFDTNIRQIGHYFVHFEHYKWNDSLLVCFRDLLHVLQSFGTMFVKSCVR